MADEGRLFGLRALIIGASSGIGEAIARTLIKHGADVLAVDVPNSGIDTQYDALRGIKGAEISQAMRQRRSRRPRVRNSVIWTSWSATSTRV